jgi:hypothetical protein
VIVRHGVNLDLVGEVSDLREDASPVQIGSEGVFDGKAFVVVGRIQYEHDLGSWNEWHLLFNDGSGGWLADAQLEYAVSFLTKPMGPPPAAEHLFRGARFQWFGVLYEVTTITKANYRGVQGELPFEYWGKERILFVDLRSPDGRFATIDFSESPPLLFTGRAVEFDELRLKNLRQFEDWT